LAAGGRGGTEARRLPGGCNVSPRQTFNYYERRLGVLYPGGDRRGGGPGYPDARHLPYRGALRWVQGRRCWPGAGRQAPDGRKTPWW